MKNIKIAVIPIAGLGTRFLPFTKVVAKEMLPILNRPTLSYIVDEAIESGIEEIVFVTSDSKQQVLDYFSRNEKLEEELIKRGKEEQANLIRHILPAHIKLTVVYQKEQLGLGHAVLQAKEVVGDQTFALLLGDDVMYSDKQPVLKQMIDKSIELDASILGVQQVEWDVVHKYGVVSPSEKIDERTSKIDGVVEKPNKDVAPSNFTIMGRYILKPEIFTFLEENNVDTATNEIQITDSIEKLSKISDVLSYEFDAIRYDMGSVEGFVKAQIEFSLRDKNLSESIKNIIKKTN